MNTQSGAMQPMPDVTARPESERSLSDLLAIVLQYKWRLALWTFAAMAVAYVYLAVYTVPKYTATTSLVLLNRDEQIVNLDGVVSGLDDDFITITTEGYMMRGRLLIGKLVDELDLTADPEFNPFIREPNPYTLSSIIGSITGSGDAPRTMPPPEQVREVVISVVTGAIGVENVRGSYIFQISATTEQPAKSALIADTLSDLYIADQVDFKLSATERATNWLAERVTELKVDLENAENAVKDFNAGTELISQEALGALSRQLKDFRERLGQTQARIAEMEIRIARMEAAAAAGEIGEMTRLAADPALDRIAERLSLGGADLATFNARFDAVLERMRTDLRREQAQSASLEQSIRDIETRVEAQSRDLFTLQQLEREAEAIRLIYEHFLGRLKETSVQQGLQQADSRVFSPAVVPGGPSAPKSRTIMAVAGLVGFMIGLSILFLRELRRSGFRSARELEEETGLPVLARIPKAPVTRRRKVLRHVFANPASAFVEAIRNLRTSILLSHLDAEPQVIMTTSALPGEGKTTQALLLAHTFAKMGKRVLLIEGDIRKCALKEYLDRAASSGLVDYVSGTIELAEAVVRRDNLGFDILLGEPISINAADFFSSRRFQNLIREARAAYDIVVIDTPPVLLVPDARVIGQHVDAIAFMVKWDTTHRKHVTDGIDTLHRYNLKVTGLVLTQIDPKGLQRYGEYGDYMAYSAYGSGYYG